MRIAAALLCATLLKCSTAAPVPPATAERARAVLRGAAAQYPGITAAVIVDGRQVWTEAAGFADVAASRRAEPSTRFRTYSSTKWITAALALRMAEKGLVDLDAPARTYLPSLPEAAGGVTLRQLLQHRAGVRHYRQGEWLTVSDVACTRASEALADFIGDPLVSKPGEAFQYSSFGYVLASAILEAAGKRPFHELLAREILAPAAMRDTNPNARPDDAVPYQRVSGAFAVAPPADVTCKFGAGGLIGNAGDLARFGAALMGGKVLSSDSLAAMFDALSTAPGRPSYGLGVTVENDEVLGRFGHHSGGALGGRSFLLIVPDKKISVALAANFEGPNLRDAAVEIARAFVE